MSLDKINPYRKISLAISIFGGVQIVNVIFGLFKSKIIAILLGPVGIGIVGLYTTILTLIGTIANLGINTSAIKDIANAYGAGDFKRVSVIIKTFRCILWVSGLLAFITSLIFSSYISKFIFNSDEHTLEVMCVSITLLINQIANGEFVILQSLRKRKQFVAASLLSSVLGLIAFFLLYYFFGIKGIVPNFILASIITLFAVTYFSRNINLSPVSINFFQSFSEGKSLVKLGFLISVTSIISQGGLSIIQIFINNWHGISQVGLYNAGFTILNSYIGMVFVAMANDYYPRLASVSDSNNECNKLMDHQAEIALLFLSPILIILIVFIDWFLVLIYSKNFLQIDDMIVYSTFGVFFKVASWPISFIFLAKGNNKLFFFNEVLSTFYTFLFNILGYYFWGLTGIGIAYFISYLIYFFQVRKMCIWFYKIELSGFYYILFGIQLSLAILAAFVKRFDDIPFNFLYLIAIIILSVILSLSQFIRRMEFRPRNFFKQLQNYN